MKQANNQIRRMTERKGERHKQVTNNNNQRLVIIADPTGVKR